MAGIFFNVTEFDEAIIKLESLTQKLKNQIIDETNASALKIQSEAKKLKELIAVKPEDRTKKNRFSISIKR